MTHKFIIKKIAKDKGFTLIEVLIAMCVFSITMLALASLQVNSINNTTKAKQLTEANALLSSQIEVLKGLPITHQSLANDLPLTQIGRYWVQRNVTNNEPPIAPVNGNSAANTIEVIVFADGQGEKRLVSRSFIKILQINKIVS